MPEENHEPTPEELRELALRNLGSEWMKGASTETLGRGQYGVLLNDVYGRTVAKVPDEDAYKALIQPALTSNDNALNMASLKERAAKTVIGSIGHLKMNDITDYLGAASPLKPEYADKYLRELSDEDKAQATHLYAEQMLEKLIADILPERATARKTTLEEKVCNQAPARRH